MGEPEVTPEDLMEFRSFNMKKRDIIRACAHIDVPTTARVHEYVKYKYGEDEQAYVTTNRYLRELDNAGLITRIRNHTSDSNSNYYVSDSRKAQAVLEEFISKPNEDAMERIQNSTYPNE